MHVKSILCAYSGDSARSSGLHHAIRLAKHHEAHLTGVLRHGQSILEGKYAAHLSDSLLAELRKADEDHIAEIATRFRETTAAEGLSDRADFLELDPDRNGSLSAFARAFDLIVTGAHSDAINDAHLSADPDTLALRTGRPILVVPDAYDAEGLADRAVVAWDGKRSVARALGDAMGILAEKSQVTLLSVGETPAGTDRMVENMTRHGVHVEAQTLKRQGSIAGTLLSEARSLGANLIVMGAFEHSKFSHDLFGGVTTDVLAKTGVPVFMAH